MTQGIKQSLFKKDDRVVCTTSGKIGIIKTHKTITHLSYYPTGTFVYDILLSNSNVVLTFPEDELCKYRDYE